MGEVNQGREDVLDEPQVDGYCTNSEMVIDPSEVEFDRADFPRQDWSNSIYTTDDCELKKDFRQICQNHVVMVLQ